MSCYGEKHTLTRYRPLLPLRDRLRFHSASNIRERPGTTAAALPSPDLVVYIKTNRGRSTARTVNLRLPGPFHTPPPDHPWGSSCYTDRWPVRSTTGYWFAHIFRLSVGLPCPGLPTRWVKATTSRTHLEALRSPPVRFHS